MENLQTSQKSRWQLLVSGVSQWLDSCATIVAAGMLLVALLVVASQGFNDPYSFDTSPLRVSTLLVGKDISGPDAALHERARPGRLILPEGRASWIRLDGIVVPDENAQSVVLLSGLQITSGRAWLYEVAPAGVARKLTEQPIALISRHIGTSIALPMHAKAGEYLVVVELVPRMPRIAEARQISATFLHHHETRYERYGGALAGMFVALAAFAFVIGAINKESTFLLFAGWLVTTYRLAAVNGGYDLEWIVGIDPASNVGQLALRLTFAVHGLLTLALFRRLFAAVLHPGVQHLLTAIQFAFVGLTAISLFVDHTRFFQLSWFVAVLALCVQIAGIVNAGLLSSRKELRLPAIAWSINISGSLLQIASASGLIPKAIPFLNSQTAAYASGFMIAIALADRLRIERIARMAAQKKAVDVLTKFRETYTSVPIGLLTLSPEGSIIQHNPAFQEMVRKGSANASGSCGWEDFFRAVGFQELQSSLLVHERAEIEVQSKDLAKWFRIHAYRSDRNIEGSIEDITARRLARERLQRLADHDSLTDLLNRRGLDVMLSATLRDIGDSHSASLAFMDMDRFKLVNDMFGHAAGDSVLQQIAKRVKSTIPVGSYVARVGGDEFVFVLRGMPIGEAKAACSRVLNAVNEQSYSVGEKQFSVVVSIGAIALSKDMNTTFAISAADRACADAKRQGGNKVVVYGDADRELRTHVAEMELVAKLRERLPVERMQMLLQPIVSLQAPYSSLSYESLLRLVDESGRLSPPTPLIQAAERHGYISQLDRWVLDTMINWLNDHSDHRERLNYCAINLSGASLNDERFLADVIAKVRENPLAARRLCFEITETVALYDLRNTCRFVDSVRSQGAKVALDDFGAGYTSFSYLKSLQANLVKIDGAFVKTIDTDRSNYAITRTIADLTHEMSMSCVAEWAESPRVVEMLVEMGVDYGQGWALAKPMQMNELLSIRSCGELVRNLEVVSILERKREPQVRLRSKGIDVTRAS